MARRGQPSPPAGLAASGKALWRSIMGDLGEGWELDARELHLLERACRCADELQKLEAIVDDEGLTVEGSRGQVRVHPALSEARALRIVQLRLLSILELDDPAQARSLPPASARARKAAQARWGRRDQTAALRSTLPDVRPRAV